MNEMSVRVDAAGSPDSSRSSSQNIDVSIDGPVATIRLTRTAKLNPLNWDTIRDLRSAVEEIDANSEVSIAVVTGSGRSFSAGGDLEGYVRLYQNPAEFAAFLEDFRQLLETIERSKIIYVAAVNGICVAGGLELLMACDIVVAASDARIGDCHLNFGQLPGAGGSQRLVRVVGTLRAKYLMLTGGTISAEEAREMGLVSAVYPSAEFKREVKSLVNSLLAKSRAGLSGAKHLANYASEHSLEDGLRHEIDFVHRYATSHPDATEGLVAFQEKRKPNFLR